MGPSARAGGGAALARAPGGRLTARARLGDGGYEAPVIVDCGALGDHSPIGFESFTPPPGRRSRER
jgi:hypothetical protein